MDVKVFFFFFQAEDGIRDADVTGVQTCALPIYQRGGGQSPASRDTPVGWQEHVADLEGIRAQLGLERLTVCGYSWGGLLAVLYFLEHPDRVDRLALVAPASITAEYRRQFEEEFARRMATPEIKRERDALRASGLRERDPAAY